MRHDVGRRRSLAPIGIVPVFLLGLLLALATPLDADEETRRLLQAFFVDTPMAPVAAPQFALPQSNGPAVRLSDFQGRMVMLYFWATW